jgi:hypothetical protein
MSEIVTREKIEVVARAIHGATDNPVLPYDYDGEIGEEWRGIHRKQAGAAILALSQSARPVASEGEEPAAYMYQMPGELEPRFQTWEGMSCNEEDAGMTETALYPQSALDAARAQERAEIVAWLKGQCKDPMLPKYAEFLNDFADAIAFLHHKEADHG